MATKLTPDYRLEKVQNNLEETNAAVSYIYSYGNLPIDRIENVDIFIKTLESGSSISAKALLEMAKILNIAKSLKNYYFSADLENNSQLKILEKYFANLFYDEEISKRILNSIIDEDTIADNASPKLSSLRRKRKNIEQNIKEKLNNFIHSTTYSKYLMEQIITIRNDRYVIPVKIDFKGNIPGSILDVSSSGSTVFIEPNIIFDLNNEINNLKAEEIIEIEKILRALSLNLMPFTNEIRNDIYNFGKIDLIFAKAKYSIDINGILPKINNVKMINFIEARHPLINKEQVVPINISIGKDYTTLIISGPNTGGKTVTLKTVGLLLSMAYSGILIPVKEGSSIYVFDEIFVDIGDEQSIMESLSTFSSHIINIKSILENLTTNSLVLIDELGSGTDPEEGSSLALSILDYIHSFKAICICTTHYREVKNYALVTDGFETASSDFDLDNLKPTYKLIIGVTGKSNAISISKKLGLPNIVIDNAKNNLSQDHVDIENLLKSIYDTKNLLEKEKEESEKNLEQIKLLKNNLKRDNSILDEKANKIISNAKREAKEILEDAKDEATRAIKKLNEYDIDNKSANNIRNSINDKIKALYSNDGNLNNVTSNINSISQLSVGDKVLVLKLDEIGTIKEIPKNKSKEVAVSIGNLNMNIKLKDLYFIEKGKETNNKKDLNKVNFSTNKKSQNIKYEINVIGLTVDEATSILDKYIDDAYIAKLENIRIVHGKGTGKLRKGIHDFLKTNPRVKEYRVGVYGEGEMGVTIVTLNVK